MTGNRRIIPEKTSAIKRLDAGNILLVPSVDNLLGDILSIMEIEIVRFRTKVRQGKALELKEARILQGYAKSLVELSKEARERDKAQDWEGMSDEQLLAALQAKIDAKKASSGAS